ncbi:MAG: uroporphyrinogen decarboxylase family protein [Candidatus Bathyarchaeia archaeon]
MDKVDRVYKALSIEEPDKLPKGELQIHDELVCALLGEQISDDFTAHVKVREILNMDLVNVGLNGGPKIEIVGSTLGGYMIFRDYFGNEWIESGKTRAYIKHALTSPEEFRDFRMPDISLYDVSRVEEWSKKTDFCVFAQVGGAFDSVYPLMGLTNYVKALYHYPNLLRMVIEEVNKFELEAIKLFADSGAHVILVGDDLAYDKGPFISLKHLKDFVFPYLAKEVALIHKRGLPAIFHCDGNVTPLIKDIVDAGFDGLHSLQPNAGVDIMSVKMEWGDRICLMGNLDLDHLLTLGSQAEIVSEVKRLIKEIAPGGGYILSTTNVLTRYVPPENALIMYKTAEKYGKYPMPYE